MAWAIRGPVLSGRLFLFRPQVPGKRPDQTAKPLYGWDVLRLVAYEFIVGCFVLFCFAIRDEAHVVQGRTRLTGPFFSVVGYLV